MNIYVSYLLCLIFIFVHKMQKSDASIILRSAFGCCASWYRTK